MSYLVDLGVGFDGKEEWDCTDFDSQNRSSFVEFLLYG